MCDKKYLGVIVADIDEYRPFLKVSEKYFPHSLSILGKDGISFDLLNVGVICVNCGIGKVNAASAAAKIAGENCLAMLNFGLSGGISGVRRGDLCVPDRFLEYDFDLTPLGYKPCEKPGQRYIYEADENLLGLFRGVLGDFNSGTAVCGDRFVSSDADRGFLKDTFGACSCDMETAAIASVSYSAGIPFASLRRISDDAGDDAAGKYSEMNLSGEFSLQDTFMKILTAAAEYYGSL